MPLLRAEVLGKNSAWTYREQRCSAIGRPSDVGSRLAAVGQIQRSKGCYCQDQTLTVACDGSPLPHSTQSDRVRAEACTHALINVASVIGPLDRHSPQRSESSPLIPRANAARLSPAISPPPISDVVFMSIGMAASSRAVDRSPRQFKNEASAPPAAK